MQNVTSFPGLRSVRYDKTIFASDKEIISEFPSVTTESNFPKMEMTNLGTASVILELVCRKFAWKCSRASERSS